MDAVYEGHYPVKADFVGNRRHEQRGGGGVSYESVRDKYVVVYSQQSVREKYVVVYPQQRRTLVRAAEQAQGEEEPRTRACARSTW